MLDRAISHVRYASRLLVRAPLFTLTAVASLAIGIGANTTIVTAANGLLLTPTRGVREIGRLVDIGRSMHGEGFDTVSYPTFMDLRDRSQVFEGMYAMRFGPEAVSLGGPDGGERIYGEQVSASYFDVIGASPAVGSFFHTQEEQLGVPLRKVVLSSAFWRQRFGADRTIAGHELKLNGDAFIVAGVAAEGFTGTTIMAPDLWIPMTAYGTAMMTDRTLRGRENSGFIMGARLRTGVSVAQARAAAQTIVAQLAGEYPEVYRDRGLVIIPAGRLPGLATGFVAPFLGVLMAAVGLVLLVACTNLTGLMLARAASRSREIAVRLALGASRATLITQLLTESLLVFAIGGLAGVVISRGMTAMLLSMLPALPVPVTLDLPMDLRVLAFTIAVTLITGLLTGLVPALQSTRPDVVGDLKADTGTPRRQRLRHVFVSAQLALCLILIVMAGLFLRALGAALNVNPGFDVDPITVASVELSMAGYPEARTSAVADEIRVRLAALPGVEGVAAAAVVPLEGNALGYGGLRRPGTSAERSESADWNVVSPEYLPTLRLPLVRGRNFSSDDRTGGPLVAIVNQHLAQRLWPDEDPVGQALESGDFRPGREADVHRFTIVGVVRDTKYQWLGESPKHAMYVPIAQQSLNEVHYLIRRSNSNGASLAAGIRGALKQFNPNLPLVRTTPLRQLADIGLLPQRMAASVAGSLGTVALLLAAIGVYGVTAFAVARRTREIGIRIALGANRGLVMRLVMRQTLKLAAIGSAIGLLISLGLARLLSNFLFGISPVDPIAFGATLGTLLAVTVLASYGPARGAARVDPLVALRTE